MNALVQLEDRVLLLQGQLDTLAKKSGFDPNQPRDEKGRWTDEGGFSLVPKSDKGFAAQEKAKAGFDKLVRAMTPKAFKEKLLGSSAAKYSLSLTGGKSPKDLFGISAKMLDAKGQRVIEFSRNFANKLVTNLNFEVHPGVQRKGMAGEALANQFSLYRELGIKKVVMEADRAGAYAWAKYGFLPTAGSWNSLRQVMKNRLGRVEDQLSDATKTSLKSILDDKDPKGIWKVADLNDTIKSKFANITTTVGRYLLLGTNWKGEFDLKSEAQKKRFNDYRAAKATSTTKLMKALVGSHYELEQQELPDEAGAYDLYHAPMGGELVLMLKAAPLDAVKDWLMRKGTSEPMEFGIVGDASYEWDPNNALFTKANPGPYNRDEDGKFSEGGGGEGISDAPTITSGDPKLDVAHERSPRGWITAQRIDRAVNMVRGLAPKAKEALASAVATAITTFPHGAGQGTGPETEVIKDMLLNLSTTMRVTKSQAQDQLVSALEALKKARQDMLRGEGGGEGDDDLKKLEDRLLILQDAIDTLNKAFDPNQPRDKDGKWSDTGMSRRGFIRGLLTAAAATQIPAKAVEALSPPASSTRSLEQLGVPTNQKYNLYIGEGEDEINWFSEMDRSYDEGGKSLKEIMRAVEESERMRQKVEQENIEFYTRRGNFEMVERIRRDLDKPERVMLIGEDRVAYTLDPDMGKFYETSRGWHGAPQDTRADQVAHETFMAQREELQRMYGKEAYRSAWDAAYYNRDWKALGYPPISTRLTMAGEETRRRLAMSNIVNNLRTVSNVIDNYTYNRESKGVGLASSPKPLRLEYKPTVPLKIEEKEKDKLKKKVAGVPRS